MRPEVEKIILSGMPRTWSELAIYEHGGAGSLEAFKRDLAALEELSLTADEAIALAMGLGDDPLGGLYDPVGKAFGNSGVDVKTLLVRLNKKSDVLRQFKRHLRVYTRFTLDCGIKYSEWGQDFRKCIVGMPIDVLTDNDFRLLLMLLSVPQNRSDAADPGLCKILYLNFKEREKSWYSPAELRDAVELGIIAKMPFKIKGANRTDPFNWKRFGGLFNL